MNKVKMVTIPGQFSSRQVLDTLLNAGTFKDYLLYEHGGEARIVSGVHYRVQINSDEMVCEGRNIRRFTQPTSDPFTDASRWLNRLDLESWTAYGYIGFDIVRFYSDYKKTTETPLLDLIIPEIDIRITETGLVIRGSIDLSFITELNGGTPIFESAEAHQLQPLDIDDRERYETAVKKVTAAIHRGELRKAIVSRRVKMSGPLDLLGTYAAASINKAARSYCFKLGQVRGVGSSPELLLEADGNGNVMTGPLAGTRPRGADAAADSRLKSELHTDSKEIMEHAISILLAQEELRSVCEADSVRITDFMEVKQFRCVQHLSSRVSGTLRQDKNVWDALRVLFPGITVSGIPKDEALRLIDQVEDEARGVYAGAVGWIDSSGAADLAIALRSVFEYDGKVQFNAGAGIVADSNPVSEYFESVNKMNTMLERTVFEN